MQIEVSSDIADAILPALLNHVKLVHPEIDMTLRVGRDVTLRDAVQRGQPDLSLTIVALM